ncbi:hypothetical protein [Erwinia sorbitola]|uniref:Uncharacterized protein n=1 Tax=Erwinia sorbitola TaxID=2681984 RepID=A0A6I6EM43_9GAMM|nr:hypothetical protein [Erwinia sorbitola]MTD26086.1 hypothetical protein [Erwinia sorbitola]QGU87376.1 hypothetical protein GN242_09175 [Erwinia sorbitola]
MIVRSKKHLISDFLQKMKLKQAILIGGMIGFAVIKSLISIGRFVKHLTQVIKKAPLGALFIYKA